MLKLLHLVQLIINMSNKTKPIVIHSQKVLSQLVEALQELNFMIYFNLVPKFWKMSNLKKPKRNENKTFIIIQLIFHLRNKIHFNNLFNQYLNKMLKQHLNNLLNQSLNKLYPLNFNNCKILNLIKIFLLSLNKLFNLYQLFLKKLFNLHQWPQNNFLNLNQ